MNNSNFGYGCRNNIDNCKFVRIYDEMKEITFGNTMIFLIRKLKTLLPLIC